MLRRLLRVHGTLLLLALSCASWAQDTGSVAGAVVSTWDGAPLNAVVVTVRGTTLAVQTGADGKYRLSSVPPGEQVLRFSKSGYATAVVAEVRVLPGQATTVNAHLRPEFFEMEEYEVTAEQINEQTAEILIERQESSGLIDAVGSEQFSRLGAGDAADIVSKLPGITVTDGKNPVVRGLNERYVGITLNGAEVPSADPYRKSAQLDLFPAGLIDRVVVRKSFTPDQPGNATGGGVNIVTKSFPEKGTVGFGFGTDVNTRTTGKDGFLSYKGGGTDWLGTDDGTRALPGSFLAPVPNLISTTVPRNNPAFGQQVATAQTLQAMTEELGSVDFAPIRERAAPNYNGNVSLGDTVEVLDRKLGMFGGLTYKSTRQLNEGISQRFVPGSVPGQLIQRKGYTDTRGIEEISWAAVANVAYQLSDQHEIGFNFLYNQNSEDVARQQVGFDNDSSNYFPYNLNRLHWTERNLTTYQLRGTHELPALGDLKVDWIAALSDTSQDEPDARFFNFAQSGDSFEAQGNFLPTPTQPTRYFRELSENNRNLKLDLTKPVRSWIDEEGALQFGAFGSDSIRDFSDREIYYTGDFGQGSPFPFTGDPNAFLPIGSTSPSVRTNRNGSLAYSWWRVVQGRASFYDAEQSLRAAYFMFDMPVAKRFKLMSGFRLESTRIGVNSISALPSAVTGQTDNTVDIKQTDVLPATSLTWTLITNMSVRISYGQTVARPSFREFAAYRSYDPVLDELLEGNPRLKMAAIDNYDLRWEWFPETGSVLAVSLFYKQLQNAIEKQFITTDGEIISYVNRPEAEVMGVEIEARHSLGFLTDQLSGVSLGMNAAVIESEVGLTPSEVQNHVQFLGDGSPTRQLYDQSPYIINADATWDIKDWGTSMTVSYSVFGPRITIAGLAVPDIYEQTAPSLDFIVSQKIGKNVKLKFGAKNLLDPRIERTYGEKADGPLYSTYRKGMSFGLSISCEF